jgi:peptide/nickel transport system permease protein
MLTYAARRLAYAILTFFGITVGVFVLIHSVPGDPVDFYIGHSGARASSPRAVDYIRRQYHLDRPLPEQYLWWLQGVVTLDFGRSINEHRAVIEVIADKLPNTLLLNFVAFVLSAAIGIPLGLWGVSAAGRKTDRAVAVLFFFFYSLPTFWAALLLMRWFCLEHDFLPLFGMMSDDYTSLTMAGKLHDRLRHMVLPVVTLAYAQVALYARFSKAAVGEVIRQDFITAARARGVSGSRILLRHAFRNALMPLITLLGLTIPYLISGSVIVERIFQWDGIGRLYFESIMTRDYPIVLGLTVVTAVLTLLASLLADLLYAVADPRVRLGKGGR